LSKLGGEIILEESEVGKGTTFAVYLPCEEDIKINNEPKNSDIIMELPEKKAMPHCTNNLPRILYVEDDPGTADVVKLFLKDLCYTDIANDSIECIRKVKEKKYSAVLMDINLSKGLDGLQTTEILRMLPGYEYIPIIAVTAYAMVGDKEEFLQRGCTHYISKPFESKKLKELMNKVFAEYNEIYTDQETEIPVFRNEI
jgi:CheY-like chemotaxis protein